MRKKRNPIPAAQKELKPEAFLENLSENVSADVKTLFEKYIRDINTITTQKKEIEVQLQDTQKQLELARKFRSDEYRPLIKDLFDEPQKKATKLTIATTIIAIICGIATTHLYSISSSQQIAETQVENIQLNEISSYLGSYKNFDYSSLNDVSIMYKLIIMTSKFHSLSKETIVKGIKTKVNSATKEKINSEVLKKWDGEMIAKYEKMIKYIDGCKKDKFTEDEVAYSKKWFSIDNDSTNFNGWYPNYEGYKDFKDGKYNNVWPVNELKIFILNNISKLKGVSSGGTSVLKK
jgi:hypothetical protein